MEFSRQENWSGLPFPSPGDLLNPGDQTWVSCIADGFFTTEPPGKAKISLLGSNLCIIKITHFKCTGMGVLVNFESLLETLCKWNRTRRLAALGHPWLQHAHRLFPFYCGIVFHWLDIALFFINSTVDRHLDWFQFHSTYNPLCGHRFLFSLGRYLNEVYGS